MNIDGDIKELKNEEQAKFDWLSMCGCCLPKTASEKTLFGTILLIIGTAWLLNIVGIFSGGAGLIWPLLFICCGLFWLTRTSLK